MRIPGIEGLILVKLKIRNIILDGGNYQLTEKLKNVKLSESLYVAIWAATLYQPICSQCTGPRERVHWEQMC